MIRTLGILAGVGLASVTLVFLAAVEIGRQLDRADRMER